MTSNNGSDPDTPPKVDEKKRLSSSSKWKFVIGLGIVVTLGLTWFFFGDYLNLERLVENESELKEFHAKNPILLALLAYVIYSLATGVSFPGATILTLIVGWFFGAIEGTVIVSFASTTGATLAFLTSRYFFHDAVQKRFEKRLKSFNEALDREGAFYLFSLRLIPAIPFFAINLVMGLTRMKVTTYWWVSQLGMLPATVLYVYAGSQIPDLKTLSEDGIQAVFTPTRLIQILVAFVLLGLFPIVTRKAIRWFRRSKIDSPDTPE